MRRAILIPGACVLLAASAAAQEPRDSPRTPPPPPELVDPADDAAQQRCFQPDAEQGIKFVWRVADADYPVASYISVQRWEGSAGWRPWLAAYARPPFTLTVRPRVYNATFAWRVWAVDKSGEAKPYATPSAWRRFCTLPAGEPPPYGSSRPP
jgi:hypothetical protein